MKLQFNQKSSDTVKSKSSTDWTTTIILGLLIALAVLGVITGKKFFEAQQTSLNSDNIKQATKMVEENPQDLDGRLALAYSYQVAERYDEARQQYLEALNLDPMNQGAWYNLGEIARLNKDYPEAEKRLTKLLDNYKLHVLGSLSLAQVYIDTKKYDKAIELMDKMTASAPYIADFHFVKGQAYEKKGNKAKAKEAYSQILKFDPENAEVKEAIKKLEQK